MQLVPKRCWCEHARTEGLGVRTGSLKCVSRETLGWGSMLCVCNGSGAPVGINGCVDRSIRFSAMHSRLQSRGF